MISGFRSYHPVPCLLYFIGMLLLGVMVTHPVYIVTMLLLLILLAALNGELRAIAGLLKFYAPISLLYALINPLFSHRGSHILFYAWDQPVTLESFAYGLFAAVNLFVILVLFVSFNAVMPPSRFLYVFGSVFPKTGLLLVMSMRFVPLLKRRYREIASVQRLKGIDAGHGGIFRRMSNGMKLLQILLALSLEEALQTADAMNAKGYGTGPRGRYEEFEMQPRDWGMLLLLLGLLAGSAAFRLYGLGTYRIFPALGAVGLQGWELVSYMIFTCYIAVPVIVEAREVWLWRSWKSKM